jgi:hypothetical protein
VDLRNPLPRASAEGAEATPLMAESTSFDIVRAWSDNSNLSLANITGTRADKLYISSLVVVAGPDM